jgi:hypothetical protein
LSEAETAIAESDKPDQVASVAKRFDVLVVVMVFGALGILLFWAYRTFARVKDDADEVGGVFGLFAPPRRRSRLRRIVGKG